MFVNLLCPSVHIRTIFGPELCDGCELSLCVSAVPPGRADLPSTAFTSPQTKYAADGLCTAKKVSSVRPPLLIHIHPHCVCAENVQSSSGLSSSLPDSEKWLEYIVATNEWYVKPTTDKGKAEGWMCIGNSVISSSVFGELNNPYCNLHQSGLSTICIIIYTFILFFFL